MKIGITSVSGQLGSAIAYKVINALGKENVIGIARTPSKAAHLGIEVRPGDYNDKDTFLKALKGIDRLLIISGNDKPDNRIQQHRNIIEAAKVNNVEKLVYTSIIGSEEGNAFSPVVNSNRQTELDVISSGLNWVIGRNGLYIEPDLEYIETYKKEGGIINCAGDGLCAYTSRSELAYAYTKLLIEDSKDQKIYNLAGSPITQSQLAAYINQVYGTKLIYQAISVDEYLKNRKEALGEFMGTVIGGIYEGIRKGGFNIPSDYAAAAGRAHQSIPQIIATFKVADE